MKPIFLGVNIDHVATVRNARGTNYPDPVTAAAIAELAGAHGELEDDRFARLWHTQPVCASEGTISADARLQWDR